jgi:uncharacterized protein YndB with AHSA1/START domain
MHNVDARRQTTDLVLEFELDAPPEKVWRAISIPAVRRRWLPKGDLAEAEPVSSKPGQEIRYRMQDGEPPFLESVVTFLVIPNTVGGTRLRIVHELVGARLQRRPSRPANNNDWSCVMRAA